MSLIQEALRRRDEESGGGESGRIPPRVVLPIGDGAQPVEKATSDGSEPGKKSHIWASLTLVLAVGLVVAVAVFAWFFYRVAPFIESAQAPMAALSDQRAADQSVRVSLESSAGKVAVRAAEPTAGPSHESVTPAPSLGPMPSGVAGPQATTPPSPAVSAVESAREAKPAVVGAISAQADASLHDRPGASSQLAGTPPSVGVETAVTARVGGKAPSAAEVKAVPVALVARTSAWPRLTLNGVMAQTGPGQGSAIINGTVVEIGEKIEGARLVEVQRNGVLVEFKGSTQFLRVGQSTY